LPVNRNRFAKKNEGDEKAGYRYQKFKNGTGIDCRRDYSAPVHLPRRRKSEVSLNKRRRPLFRDILIQWPHELDLWRK
jgi:hypothetical protein